MGKKILNLLEFFKSTLLVNISLSTVSMFFGGITIFATVFLSFGFVLSISIIETNRKNNYLFYYNNGLSKKQLWIFSYIFTVLGLVLLTIIRNLFIHYFG